MKFTHEQQAAIDLAAQGDPFSLVAPAGSGKSATAVGIGKRLKSRRILYLVYNTAARKEAEVKFKDMPWVDVRTTSQIAWREYAYIKDSTYGERMKPKAECRPAREVAKTLGLQPVDFGSNLILDGYIQAKLAEEAIERFCNSDRQKIEPRDVPLVVAGVEPAAIEAARTYIAKLAWKLWNQAITPTSKLRFTMNHAFKLVSMGDINYGYDTVLIDEAQDSNDATMRFLRNQKDAQGILVGDPAQALYGWRGASDQIMHYPGERLYLTQSFRFGPAVAEEAMKHLPHTETGVTIRGLDTIKDKVTNGEMAHPDVVLTRTNAGAMEWAMSYLDCGKRVALVRGTQQILDLAYAAGKLMKGERPNNLELSAFETWGDLVAYTEEPGGGHLKAIVRLVNAHGVSKLIDACKKMVDYNPRYPKHDVAVTTCHSIKGLEWNNVQIGDDFFEPRPFENPLTKELEPGTIDKHEAMIHYVAVTRAKSHLDRSGLSWVDDYPAPAAPALVGG